MPHPTKKQRLEGNRTTVDAADNDFVASFDDLSVDVLANILGFLSLKHIMCSRRINKKTMEAVKKTIVPLTEFCVNSVERYNAVNVMTRAMPNLQKIHLRSLGRSRDRRRHKWSDGEDPNEEVTAGTANYTSHDIGIISNFRKLRILEISSAGLNGIYPVFFNFPLLQKLCIYSCYGLKWNMEMLAGLPLLKELMCRGTNYVTGNISSLRALKDTLEKVNVYSCDNVEGNLMDLADFPQLKVLNLYGTAVTGDIRDIGGNHFSSLEELKLPSRVYGGNGYELQRISDAPDLIRAVYHLKKQRPGLVKMKDWYAVLSRDSIDWYQHFFIRFVRAGSRDGYQWRTYVNLFITRCEVNWLDPEPDRESSRYSKYIEKLEKIERRVEFKGYHQPPTQEEYSRLVG
jgi:hypothetical protein